MLHNLVFVIWIVTIIIIYYQIKIRNCCRNYILTPVRIIYIYNTIRIGIVIVPKSCR